MAIICLSAFLVTVLINHVLNGIDLCSTVVSVHNDVSAAATFLGLQDYISEVTVCGSLSLLNLVCFCLGSLSLVKVRFTVATSFFPLDSGCQGI